MIAYVYQNLLHAAFDLGTDGDFVERK